MNTKTCTDTELADVLSHFIECVSLSHLDLLATILKRYDLMAALRTCKNSSEGVMNQYESELKEYGL